MSLEVKVAECCSPLEGCDEDKTEKYSNSLKKNNDRVNLNVVELFSKVVVELISIDEEVSAEQSGNSETEQEALDVDDEFDYEESRCCESKPFEEISVGDVTDE